MTLYTSDINTEHNPSQCSPSNDPKAEILPERKPLAKTGYFYLLFAGFCLLFGIIYEHFSHGVTSVFMTHAFLIPLLAGALPSLALSLIRFPMLLPAKESSRLWHFGIITLTIGSLVRGILDIYGTTNQKITLYLIAGIVFLAIGVGSYILRIYYHVSKVQKSK